MKNKMSEYKTDKNKKKIKHGIIMLFALAGIILLNLLAWMAPLIDRIPHMGNWCDWYVRYITPIWVNIFSRLTNIFPFSIGEIMIIMGILLVVAVLVISISFIFLRKREGFLKFFKSFYILQDMCLWQFVW